MEKVNRRNIENILIKIRNAQYPYKSVLYFYCDKMKKILYYSYNVANI